MANPWLVLVKIVLFGRVMSLWLLEALLPNMNMTSICAATYIYIYI